MRLNVRLRWVCAALNKEGVKTTYNVWANSFSDACIVACARLVGTSCELIKVSLLENDEPIYTENWEH